MLWWRGECVRQRAARVDFYKNTLCARLNFYNSTRDDDSTELYLPACMQKSAAGYSFYPFFLSLCEVVRRTALLYYV